MIIKRIKLLAVVLNVAGIFIVAMALNTYAQNKVVVVPFFGEEPTGNAIEGDVLQSKTFSNANGTGLTGTRPIAPVAKTGVTMSFVTGDDGDLQKGVAWPNPRFTDNGNGTVTDNLTELIWLKNAGCFGIQAWQTALNDCNGLASGSCDLTDGSIAGDWRLPNRFELESLLDMSQFNPALPSSHPFSNVMSTYWSSTHGGNINTAWYVNMQIGKVDVSNVTAIFTVWPVRGGN